MLSRAYDRGMAEQSGETVDERLERNWDEILQELRVTQTGTQILLGFLLTIPFQQRFADLDGGQIGIYLALVVVAALATIFAITPVALHRALFRRGAKPQLVVTANVLMRIALAAIALALSGTVFLIFDVVLGHPAALAAGLATLALTAAMWALLPSFLRKRE